jgi:hypothetical protein
MLQDRPHNTCAYRGFVAMILRPRSKRRGCIQPLRLIPFGKAVTLILSSYAAHVSIIQPDLEVVIIGLAYCPIQLHTIDESPHPFLFLSFN